MPYNILNCNGFDVTGAFTGGGCMRGRLGIVFLFFIIALVRKWGGEEIGLNFNFWIASIGSIVSYFVIISITGNYKIAFVVGIVVALLLGYGAGMFLGDGGEY